MLPGERYATNASRSGLFIASMGLDCLRQSKDRLISVTKCKLNISVIVFYCELTYFGTCVVFAEADVSWWMFRRL